MDYFEEFDVMVADGELTGTPNASGTLSEGTNGGGTGARFVPRCINSTEEDGKRRFSR